MIEHYPGEPDEPRGRETARERMTELRSEKAQRKRAERVLRKNAEFLRGILDTTALSGVFVADDNGVIIFANPRTEEITGMPLDQFGPLVPGGRLAPVRRLGAGSAP